MKHNRLAAAIAASIALSFSMAWADQASDETSSESTDASESSEEAGLMELVEVVAEKGYRATKASSATGLNIDLDQLPVNIQVINSDVVADFQLLSQRDALQFHAAVDDKRVRGFSTGEFFRNGVIHLSDTPGYTIERMEVMRGPSAVLNGPVTPGGAVNIITKKPMQGENFGEFGTYWGVSDGRDNSGLNFDLNVGSLGADSSAAFRFVGGYQNDTGFGSRVDNQSHSILPMLQLRPSENTIIDLEYYQYEINTDRTDRPMGIELSIPGPTAGEEIPFALAYGVDPRSSWFGEDTDIEESLSDYTVSVKHEFSDSALLNFNYNNHSRDFIFGPGNRPRIDIFYAVVPVSGAPAGSTDPDDFQLRRLTENLSLTNDISQYSGSITALPDFGGDNSHQFNFGFHVYDQDAHLTIQRPRPSGATGGFYFDFFNPATIATDDLTFNQAGADLFFVTVLNRLEFINQTNYFVNYMGTFMDDRLNVLLGVTNSTIEIERVNLNGAGTRDQIADNTENLLQAGAVYAVNDTVAVYGNYSESQLPDVNDPDFSTTPPVRLGEQKEVGIRLDLLDGALTTSIAYFMIDEELFGETSRSAEADGWEVDGSWLPNDNLELSFSYAHADTKVTASSNASQVGDPLVDEVPNKAALWGRYKFGGSKEGLAVGGGFIWTGDRVRPNAGAGQSVKKLNGVPLRYEAETRLDLFATYDRGNMQYSLNLRNLTRDVNLSNNVPRVPLQGGVRPDGSPYVFKGDVEIMAGFKYRY